MARVPIPQVDAFSERGILALSSALGAGWEAHEPVALDLNACGFLSAEGVAVLAGFKLLRDQLGPDTQLELEGIPPECARTSASRDSWAYLGMGRRSARETLFRSTTRNAMPPRVSSSTSTST